MRHIDDRGPHALVQALDLGAHVDTAAWHRVGERLVEQEDLRIAHQRPAHGNTLALAAGKLARLAVEQMADLQDLRDLLDRFFSRSSFGTLRISMPKAMFPATVMFG